MKSTTYDLVVIGGGPAGIEAIREAGLLGMRTAIILNAPAGGRAAKGSLVPSKVWLAAAEEMDHLRHPLATRPLAEAPQPDLARIKQRIMAQSEATVQWSRAEIEKAGVRMITGTGKVIGPNQVKVVAEEGDPEFLTTRFILLATGSGPRFRPDLKPDMKRIIAPRLASGLTEIPESLIMAGGGVTGAEYAYAFAALGTRVTLLQSQSQLLPRMDADISHAFARYLESTLPITIHMGDAAASMAMVNDQVTATTRIGRIHTAQYGFIATGRQPDSSWLEDGGFSVARDNQGFVRVDDHAMTSQVGVYAAGDVTGAPMMANRAQMQARIAVRHMAEGEATGWQQHPVIEGVYTHPPAAQIGDMSPDPDARWIVKSYDHLLKARLKEAGYGLLKIKVQPETGAILGAAAFGLQAPDLLASIQTALLNGISYDRLRGQVQAYPGFAELVSL